MFTIKIFILMKTLIFLSGCPSGKIKHKSGMKNSIPSFNDVSSWVSSKEEKIYFKRRVELMKILLAVGNL